MGPRELGQRIADARGRADVTQADLAAQIGMDRSALAKVESGSRRVSALELSLIAEALDERIEWFFTDPPAAVIAYRNQGDPGAPSADIDRVVERLAREVEFLLRDDAAFTLTRPAALVRPKSAEETERSAAKARMLLGLDQSEPCLDIASRATRVGLLTFCLHVPAAPDAASLLLQHGGAALVNGKLKVGRRRLAAAHELGHHLFADEYTVDWRIDGGDDVRWEGTLDRFARAVLLPAAGLDEVWTRFSGEGLRTAAVRAASHFRVDMSTLARRLLDLGYADHDAAAQVRQVRTTKADIVDFDLLVSEELAAPYLPRVYQESVLREYREERISPERALDLLLDTFEDQDLPILPLLPESAIWSFV